MRMPPRILGRTVDQVGPNLLALKHFLQAQGAPFNIHLVFLEESPQMLSLLTPEERAEFTAAAKVLSQELFKAMPDLQPEIWGNFKAEDYFDLVHYNELGQRKLAAQILKKS